jgi:hypothetical protein
MTDHELQKLLEDTQAADRAGAKFRRDYEPLAPRLSRVLHESRELRDQAAERTHMADLEHGG